MPTASLAREKSPGRLSASCPVGGAGLVTQFPQGRVVEGAAGQAAAPEIPGLPQYKALPFICAACRAHGELRRRDSLSARALEYTILSGRIQDQRQRTVPSGRRSIGTRCLRRPGPAQEAAEGTGSGDGRRPAVRQGTGTSTGGRPRIICLFRDSLWDGDFVKFTRHRRQPWRSLQAAKPISKSKCPKVLTDTIIPIA